MLYSGIEGNFGLDGYPQLIVGCGECNKPMGSAPTDSAVG